MQMNANSRSRGFTLIELMVTVAILALLVGIAIPVYQNYVSTSRNVEAFNNMNSIRLAEEEYYMENNSYVTGVKYDASTNTKTLQTSALGWSPAEPDNKQNFSYEVKAVAATASNSSSYQIIARGIDRQVPSSVLLTLE